MATRSAIGIKFGPVVKAVYCHWDGYPEHNGEILKKYYSDSVKLSALIAQGDLSSLGAEIGTKHDFDQKSEYVDWPEAKVACAKECTFYKRDRGEQNIDFRTFAHNVDLFEHYNEIGVEFIYVYAEGQWYITDTYTGKPEWKLLDDVLKSISKETDEV